MTDDLFDDGSCLIEGCDRDAEVRGLCRQDHAIAAERVRSGSVTWAKLEAAKLCKPAYANVNQPSRSTIAKAIDAIESSDTDFPALMDAWNAVAKERGFSQCKSQTPQRIAAWKKRLADPFVRKHWPDAIAVIGRSDFHCGKNDRKWKATIDWFLRPNSVATLMEMDDGLEQKPARRSGRHLEKGARLKREGDRR